MRLTFKEIKDEISKIVPRNIEYNVDLEAGDIAIFTKDFEPFVSNEGLAGKISKKIIILASSWSQGCILAVGSWSRKNEIFRVGMTLSSCRQDDKILSSWSSCTSLF